MKLEISKNGNPVDVPKVIHYCWFGGNPLSQQAKRSIASWGKYASGFEVKRWDESNFDIAACAWSRDAYSAEKWAFVADYARFRILHDHGGVYMDVGSELVRDISPLIPHSPFSAIENGTKTVASGLVVSCEAADPVVGEVLDAYERMGFDSDPDFLIKHTVNAMLTAVFERHGYVRENRLQYVNGWVLLPCECFDPKAGLGGFVVTENTFSVHHGSASWAPEHERFRVSFINKWTPVLGDFTARKVARLLMMARYGRRR
ncbi:hypothetical protein B5F41_10790 [Gordonibacter sp. An232A]|nr:hypothetical protein B5F41_10790 [Gordonibacter sp. An232A]